MSKLEARLRKLERVVREAHENGAMVSISSEAGELVVSSDSQSTDAVAQTALGLYEHLRQCRGLHRREVV